MSTETHHTESGNSPPDGATVAELESREPATEAEAAELDIEAPCPRHRLNAPPPAECVRILRAKHLEALVCVTCGTMLASEAKSYAKSLFMIVENPACRRRFIESYVCGECRWENAEAARVKALRADNLRRNLGLSQSPVTRVAGAARRGTQVRLGGPKSSLEKSGTSNTVLRHTRAGKGGRPTVPLSEQQLKARERSRAYRSRQRLAEVAP